MADQWKDFFYSDALPTDILVARGMKRPNARSANVRGDDNIISAGSVIAVANGQAMAVVEQGKVVEFTAEPGEFVFDNSTEPSVFAGTLGEAIENTFATMGKRFTFGGQPATDQRVYYFNLREITGNKYGTPSPIPFRVVDTNIGLDIDISIRCHGKYSYRVMDPIRLYTNVTGNVASVYRTTDLDSQLKAELLTALQPAFARISAQGVRISALPGHTEEIAAALRELLSSQWGELRGIEMATFGIKSVTPLPEDAALISDLQRQAVMRNADMAGAALVGAQADAMRTAAGNNAGAMMGFLGMNAAMNAGGAAQAGQFFDRAAGVDGGAAVPGEVAVPVTGGVAVPAGAGAVAGTWTCSCGSVNTGRFCPQCGTAMPAPAATWICSCGERENTGNFCSSCGAGRPDPEWTCTCGHHNTGRFCAECGQPQG